MQHLKVFYAVTTTSLYRVEWKDTLPSPIVKKIAMVGQSDVPVGRILQGGYYLGIMDGGLILYGTERQPPELVNTRLWGGGTSQIVGLFLGEDEARECLNSGELTPLNPRWRRQTEETLEAIGDDHPKFVHSSMHAIRYD